MQGSRPQRREQSNWGLGLGHKATILSGTLLALVLVLGAVLPTPATADEGREHLLYGVPVPPGQEVTLPPEAYQPARHGPPLANTQPQANAVGKRDVKLPERPLPPQTRPSSTAVPAIVPGSGDRGFWVLSGSGIYAINDARTDLSLPGTAIGTTIYAPTHMAAGNTCIETVTAHWRFSGMAATSHGHGFWDWCETDGTGGWQVFEFMDAAWQAKYVRTTRGQARYSTQVFKNGVCWSGLLFNYGQGQWEEKTTICGSGPYSYGWTMWESHYMMDQARVCPKLPPIEASGLQVLAGTWQRLTNENSSQLGPYGLCWDNTSYTFHVHSANDDWHAHTR